MIKIHEQHDYAIFSTDDGYLVQNMMMEGFVHSHINNYRTCLWIIDLLEHKKCPYDIPKYLLISLIRLTDDERYLDNLNCLLKNKSHKQRYYNKNACFKKR